MFQLVAHRCCHLLNDYKVGGIIVIQPSYFSNPIDQLCLHTFRKNIFKPAQLWLQFFFTPISYSSEPEAKFSARHNVERLLARIFHFGIRFCKLIHILLPIRAPSSNSTLGFWYPEHVSLIWSMIISYVNCFYRNFTLRRCRLVSLMKSLYHGKWRIWYA